MSDFYKDMRGIANDILGSELGQSDTKKRQTINYVHLTPGNGPADDPGPSGEAAYPLNGTASGVSQKYVDNSIIIQSDLQVMMGYRDDIEPNISGFVTVNSVRHKLIAVKRVPEAGTVVVWVLVIRK